MIEIRLRRSLLFVPANRPELFDKALEAAFETYDLMSTGHFTHASPTLFHAGTTVRRGPRRWGGAYHHDFSGQEGRHVRLQGQSGHFPVWL